MSGADPQRTSWLPAGTNNENEVRGAAKPAWYRAIDPYIDNKVEVIAADNKVFVSTSKGLYAFDATTGSQSWVYGTEMPLGNSPTYFNGTLYVGGFDNRIHAVNSSNGQAKTGWTFTAAGAGFDTNPLVTSDSFTNNQPIVYAGSRDGYMYALNGNTGSLIWKFQTGGPINYSAAYKSGILYFGSDDNYAYAVNAASGSQIWKSSRLPGVGFLMYWPVIWTDKFTNPTSPKDYVVFTGSQKTVWGWGCQAGTPLGCQSHTPTWEMYQTLINSGCAPFQWNPACLAGPVGNEPYSWVTGTSTVRADIIYNYYNNNPTKWNGQPPVYRETFVLDLTTGQEVTPYPTYNPAGTDGQGQGYRHPPIVGSDNVLYNFIGYYGGGNSGAHGGIAGWKFGTPYISRVHDFTSGQADEPVTFTGGGSLMYYGEGVNADAFGTIEITKPLGSNAFWQWDPHGLPGASAKYSSLYLWGKFGGNNGTYTYMDGVLNQSPIPYQGKLFFINGNVLFAMSPTGSATAPLATVSAPSTTVAATPTVTASQIQAKLEAEVQKMVNAGHLRPGFLDLGQQGQFFVYSYSNPVPNNHILENFSNPADTVTTLVNALPYLSSGLQSSVKTYLQTYYGLDANNNPAPYSVTKYASIGWKNGAKRELYDDLPEFTKQINDTNDYNYYAASLPRTFIHTSDLNLQIGTSTGSGPADGGFPPENFYGAWKYATVFPSQALAVFNLMKNKLTAPDPTGSVNDMTDANLIKYPYILNEYIVGFRGYMELEKAAGATTAISQSSKYAEYTRLVNLRLSNYSNTVPWDGSYNHNNGLNITRNILYMTPELADILRTNKLTEATQTLSQNDILTPYWFVTKYDRSYAESYFRNLQDYYSNFQANALILKKPFNELVKYLDVPAFATGDLFYINNLVTTLNSTTITPPPPSPYDINKDGKIDLLDLARIVNARTATVIDPYSGPEDVNGDTKLNQVDLDAFLFQYTHL